MSEHTSGPWRAFLGLDNDTGLYPASVCGPTGHHVAEIHRPDPAAGGCYIANAHLIAAAPDGHAIALWALKVCEALDYTDLNHVTLNEHGQYLRDAILAYVARAEGR